MTTTTIGCTYNQIKYLLQGPITSLSKAELELLIKEFEYRLLIIGKMEKNL